jgi:hypothetical protein
MSTYQYNEKYDIPDLLICLLENDLTDSQRDYLIEWSRNEPDASLIYHNFVRTYSLLSYEISSRVEAEYGPSSDSHLDKVLWEALLEHEQTAPEIQVQQFKPEDELIQKIVYPAREKRKMSRFGIFMLMNAAAVLLLFLFLEFAPHRGGKEVALLADSLNAKWANSESRISNGDFINTGDKSLVLSEGYAEFLFNNRTKVTIEGPSEFQILAEDQVKLIYGRLYAVVSREAIGFIVKTPSAQIVDLGTEFGVETDLRSDTSLHVMKGKTVLIAGDKSNKASIEVKEGAAKQVSAATRTISDISCNNRLFVREIDSAGHFIWRGETELSLADIVGGGNGFGKVSSLIGLDPATGQYTSSVVENGRRSQNAYNPVPDSKFIDGVFVPDGGQNGSIVITSLNHTFQCPDTVGGFTHEIAVFTGDIGNQHRTIKSVILNGQPYINSPVLMLHSNVGITFDLQALRQSIPQLELTTFKAFGGLSEAFEGVQTGAPDVDFWVLVDGQIRYEKKAITLKNNHVDFNIELNPHDRFLTLIVTDGSGSEETNRGYKAWNNDFFYLVDPKLCGAGTSD